MATLVAHIIEAFAETGARCADGGFPLGAAGWTVFNDLVHVTSNSP